MSVKLTRRQQKEATRDTVRAAARGCFVDRGFAATGIGDICAAAGVAHGTFYIHYPSKEAVLDELLAELNQELAGKLAPALAGRAGDLEPAVRAAAAIFIDFCREHDRLVACYVERAAAGLDPAAFRDGINPPVAALLRAALAAVAPPTLPSPRLRRGEGSGPGAPAKRGEGSGRGEASRLPLPAKRGEGWGGGPDLELVVHGLLAMWLRVALQHLAGGASRAAAVRVLVTMTVGALGAVLDQENDR